MHQYELADPVVPVKSKVKISQNFVAFSEYFTIKSVDLFCNI